MFLLAPVGRAPKKALRQAAVLISRCPSDPEWWGWMITPVHPWLQWLPCTVTVHSCTLGYCDYRPGNQYKAATPHLGARLLPNSILSPGHLVNGRWSPKTTHLFILSNFTLGADWQNLTNQSDLAMKSETEHFSQFLLCLCKCWFKSVPTWNLRNTSSTFVLDMLSMLNNWTCSTWKSWCQI